MKTNFLTFEGTNSFKGVQEAIEKLTTCQFYDCDYQEYEFDKFFEHLLERIHSDENFYKNSRCFVQLAGIKAFCCDDNMYYSSISILEKEDENQKTYESFQEYGDGKTYVDIIEIEFLKEDQGQNKNKVYYYNSKKIY